MKWTTPQQNAINIPVSDIIVSAAAGSGKTAVMAERIINRLTGENPVDIDRILVVTYTNAAASEIRERVMKKILEKLSENSSETLQKQLILLNNAHFCTIHSFCLDLLKKYFYKLGIDPMVKTGDEADLEIMLQDSASNVIKEYFANNDEEFYELMNSYANGKEANMQNIILSLYKFSRTMPQSTKWLLNLPSFYSENCTDAEKQIVGFALMALEYVNNEYKKAVETISQTITCEKWLGVISSEQNATQKALKANKTYADFYNAIWGIEFKSLPPTKGENEKNKAYISACRDAAKKTINSLKEKLFGISPEFVAQDNANIYPKIKKLAEAVIKLGNEFDRIKRSKNTIDFSDYEHMTLSLLKNPDNSPSDIAFEISNQFDEIYVDEFQDCNNIQNEIFSLISGGIRNKPNLFCVGDMKQSIYKFRDANPLNFRKRCETSVLYDGKNTQSANKIFLNANFRSRDSVLCYVNSVFSQLMSEECGELCYTAHEALNYGGSFENVNPAIEEIEIDIINESNDFGQGFEMAKNHLDKTEAEAAHIASKIKEYIDSGYMLYNQKTKSTKKASYRDFVILLRSPKSAVSAYTKIFNEFGIPLYCDNSGGYFETDEVEFLINLLKITDNPDDDISLVTVMKNPIFGFNENTLLEIRLKGGKGSFYSCIKKYIKENNNQTQIKLNNFLSLLDNYHLKSKYMESDEFIDYILSDLDYYVYLSAFPDSKIRKENVRFLIQRAKQFENNNFKGIFSFIKYVENIKDSKSDECAKTIGENDDVVRLMSIHKSKGLEFPVVILAGTGKQFNTQDIKNPLVIHKDSGVGADSVYPDKGYKLPSLNKISIKQKIKYETISEELRVLYVALTRPIEKLIITGTVKNGSSFLNSIERTLSVQKSSISPYIVAKAKNFLELIVMASMRSENCELASDKGILTPVSDNIKYNIKTINIGDITLCQKQTKPSDWQFAFDGVTKAHKDISSVLSFEYPHSPSSLISGNLTVTEIKRMNTQNENETTLFDEITLKKPANFAQNGKIYGNIMGTLIHLCMEKLDLTNISNEEAVLSQLGSLVFSGVISEKEKDAIDISRIVKFANSPLGQRIAKNYASLKKEFSFKILTDVSEIYKISSADEIIVQGTIDAYFEEDGEIVLVDYKTDKVNCGNSKQIAQRYSVQLECYSKALEQITGKRVKQKLIYLFDTNEILEL